ncbi:tail fiber assembly protein [Erwinia sp. V71]|uniref:tail fiber assembly protein n=1 Tax=Erwinia sp. V71 TaxID=3369424 RepID=UPI003F61B90A
MDVINILDEAGFYIGDFVIGVSGENLPAYWTFDRVGDGYYKAQYQNATRNDDTGELSGGDWVETGEVPPPDYLSPVISERDKLIADATQRITVWQTKLLIGRKLTTEETTSLNAWLDYIDSLEALDLTTAPDIEWPESP